MEKVNILWTAILFSVVSLSMTVIFISTMITYYRRKQSFQRKKMAELASSERKYRVLVNSMNDVVFSVDCNEKIILYNDEFARVFNLNGAKDKLMLSEVLDGETYSMFSQNILDTIQNGTLYSCEHALPINDDTNWFEISFIPQTGDNSDINSVLCIAHDFTIRKNLNIQLLEAITTLESQQAILKDLSKEIIRAQEEERKSISRDLHDEIGQSLTAISFNLEILNQSIQNKDANTSQRLTDSKKLVTKTMQDIHRFVHELRPTLLDDLGLASAINSLARKFSERTGINVSVSDQDSRQQNINANTEIVLYRIFQEALNNISKHSQAKHVKVDLYIEKSWINLSIADDGVGFKISDLSDTITGRGGLGIKGMKERVRLIDGKLDLTSKPEAGTTVFVKAPID